MLFRVVWIGVSHTPRIERPKRDLKSASSEVCHSSESDPIEGPIEEVAMESQTWTSMLGAPMTLRTISPEVG